MWYPIKCGFNIIRDDVHELVADQRSVRMIHECREVMFSTVIASIGMLASKEAGFDMMDNTIVYYLLQDLHARTN